MYFCIAFVEVSFDVPDAIKRMDMRVLAAMWTTARMERSLSDAESWLLAPILAAECYSCMAGLV